MMRKSKTKNRIKKQSIEYGTTVLSIDNSNIVINTTRVVVKKPIGFKLSSPNMYVTLLPEGDATKNKGNKRQIGIPMVFSSEQDKLNCHTAIALADAKQDNKSLFSKAGYKIKSLNKQKNEGIKEAMQHGLSKEQAKNVVQKAMSRAYRKVNKDIINYTEISL